MIVPATNLQPTKLNVPNMQSGKTECELRNPGSSLYLQTRWQQLSKHLGLSRRESQMAQAIFDDHSEQVIAERLEISVHTVHTYLKRLFQKLDARSRVEVVCILVAAERRLDKQSPQGDGRTPATARHPNR